MFLQSTKVLVCLFGDLANLTVADKEVKTHFDQTCTTIHMLGLPKFSSKSSTKTANSTQLI